MADGGRRGARTVGDDSGAGVVMRRASATELVQNQIELNAGAGVFADALSEGQLSRNVLKGGPNNKPTLHPNPGPNTNPSLSLPSPTLIR